MPLCSLIVAMVWNNVMHIMRVSNVILRAANAVPILKMGPEVVVVVQSSFTVITYYTTVQEICTRYINDIGTINHFWFLDIA